MNSLRILNVGTALRAVRMRRCITIGQAVFHFPVNRCETFDVRGRVTSSASILRIQPECFCRNRDMCRNSLNPPQGDPGISVPDTSTRLPALHEALRRGEYEDIRISRRSELRQFGLPCAILDYCPCIIIKATSNNLTCNCLCNIHNHALQNGRGTGRIV